MGNSAPLSSELKYLILEADESLLEVFQEEATDLYDKLLLGLEGFLGQGQPTYLMDVARDLHTLKGCAQLISYHGLAEICHALEEAMKVIVHEREPGFIDNIYKAFKFIELAASQIHTHKVPIPPLDILSGLSKQVGLKFESSLKNLEKDEKVASSFAWDQTGYRVSMQDMEGYFSSVRRLIKTHSNYSWQMKHVANGVQTMYERLDMMDVAVKKMCAGKMGQRTDGLLSKDDVQSHMAQLKILLGAMNRHCQIAEGINEKQGSTIKGLDNEIVNARLEDFRYYIPRLEQTVKKTADKLNKKIKLTCQHIEVEVDKRLLEKLMPVFEHLIRNAIDHGIESTADRNLAGKNLTGHIDISLKRESNHIVFKFADDGQGVDVKKIWRIAQKQGLVGPSESLSQQKAIELLKKTGFSTKENATIVSGRGVGVNAVDHLVQSLGGQLTIEFKSGKGTTFIITLPITQSQHAGLLFYINGIHYFFALSHIVGITRTPVESNVPETVHYGNQNYPLICLAKYFGHTLNTKSSGHHYPVVVIEHHQGAVALRVEKIIGVRDFIIQPAPTILPHKNIFDGLSILSEGNIVYGIDTGAFLQELEQKKTDLFRRSTPESQGSTRKTIAKKVLIVDDSKLVKAQLKTMLQEHQWDVHLANNGLEALTLLKTIMVDLIVTDIEMPQMDGFELSRKLKSVPQFQAIPIIMMTARRQVEDFVRAQDIGIQKFLQKPITLAMLKPYIDEHHDDKH